jgi:3-phosphoshikimate 1-carboxyvinyltransferase
MTILSPHRGSLQGTCRVPGDKSISHRAVLLAPVSGGACRITGWLRSADTLRSLEAVRALGAEIHEDGQVLSVQPGRFPLKDPLTIDCGNSGTTARLLCGLAAGLNCDLTLDGDASLRGRPMARVVDPLREAGADITYTAYEGRLPLRIKGRTLHGGTFRLAQASAQVKSALLLAGLNANGATRIAGCGASRDHTEILLRATGARIQSAPHSGGHVQLLKGARLQPFSLQVPGDPSSAAFPVAAALMLPGSRITLPEICANPTRAGFFQVIEAMGAGLQYGDIGISGGEPVATVTVSAGPLQPFAIDGARVPTLIDELPVLCVLAARADGTSRLRGAAELRVKESDRIAGVAAGLRKLGVTVEEYPDGLDIVGQSHWGSGNAIARIETLGDHRLAMAFAVASLVSDGQTELDDTTCVDVSFPGFFQTLDSLKG